jgi:hypothetical protein
MVDASLFAARNEPGALEYPQVTRDRRGRDTVGRGQVAHGRFTARQMADDSPPDRVGQGGEHGVERRLPFVNHYVNYYGGGRRGVSSGGPRVS